jgi:hypothetical protein
MAGWLSGSAQKGQQLLQRKGAAAVNEHAGSSGKKTKSWLCKKKGESDVWTTKKLEADRLRKEGWTVDEK